MSFNTFGRVFRFSTWGESHGPALGALVDGCPPGLALSEADIQPFLDQRRPGTSRFTTQRQEPDAVRELERVMQQKFQANTTLRASQIGGVKAAAKIMNFTKVNLETAIMNGVSSLDEELALKIQDSMFTFENLGGVDNRAIQVLMRNVESDLLMTALKGAGEEVRDKFLDNMSQRARAMFIDDMESKGPMRLTDVEAAQKTIMRLARKLSDAGDLVLSGRGDDFV